MAEFGSPASGTIPPTGNQNRKVVIFGGGIAGLSAAHELIRLGYAVQVYEANGEAGGFFRSARSPENGEIPSEYSWHGMGPWYNNDIVIIVIALAVGYRFI